jgi:hypothetical protein
VVESTSEPADAASLVPVVVSVWEDHLERLDEIAGRLRAHGLRVDQLLTSLGTVTGRIAPSKIVDLEDVDGVASVERERVVQLPPPDSPVQ